MRKRNNQGGPRRHSGHGGHGGQRRYSNNPSSGGGNRGGGGGDHQNLARQKHHAMQMREKYMNHARDAQINGDRVDVEYYLQHVDHYNRMLTDIGAIEAERQERFREQQVTTPQGAPSPEQGGDQQPQAGGGGEEQPIQPGNQPRMTRGPRPHNPQQGQHDRNGAEAANANTDDIPLPGGVIGAI